MVTPGRDTNPIIFEIYKIDVAESYPKGKYEFFTHIVARQASLSMKAEPRTVGPCTQGSCTESQCIQNPCTQVSCTENQCMQGPCTQGSCTKSQCTYCSCTHDPYAQGSCTQGLCTKRPYTATKDEDETPEKKPKFVCSSRLTPMHVSLSTAKLVRCMSE